MPLWITSLFELVENWNHVIRRDGWKSSQAGICKDIMRLPYRRIIYILFALPLSRSMQEYKPRIDLEIRPFGWDDLEFVRRENLPSEAHLLQRRLQRGDRGLVATIEGEPAGYAWMCSNARLERVELKLDPGDCLCNDVFTVPTHRNKGVKTSLCLAVAGLSRELGYKRLVAHVDISNSPALRVWEKKLGSDVIGCLDFKRFGAWRRTRYLPVRDQK